MSGAKAVFLDRDGTINVDRGYVFRREEFEYLPTAKEALRRISSLGYLLVIVTNQSGIARGMYSETDYERLTSWMVGDLEESGIRISGVYHCPHHPEFTGSCDCRKPALGLFYKAASELGIDLDASWAVGDKERDLAICSESKCRGIILDGNPAIIQRFGRNIATASSLDEAATIIENGGLV